MRLDLCAQAVLKEAEGRGWVERHFSPCSALRSCGRRDEHWCRARSPECAFPQVRLTSNAATAAAAFFGS